MPKHMIFLFDSFIGQNILPCKMWLVACNKPSDFFPIHWSELSTSLKATLRVSDLSFGSLSEHFALQNVTCLASHRIYLSDSLSEQINCVNLRLNKLSRQIYLSDSLSEQINCVNLQLNKLSRRISFRFTIFTIKIFPLKQNILN